VLFLRISYVLIGRYLMVMNRSTIAIITVISMASIFSLVTNLNPIPLQQVYAVSPNTSDLKQDVKQDVNQDNTCNRDDSCKQTINGQQVEGKDNAASGFNDQSDNAISLSTPDAASSQGTQGLQGLNATNGVQEPVGIQGPPGPAGAKGDTGPQGLQGPPGISPQPPVRNSTLIVIKHVDNSGAGGLRATANDFILHVNGNNPSPFDFPGSESGTKVAIAQGPYAVTESKPPGPYTFTNGYFVSYSSDCVGDIGDGETKTCTVTNTFKF
jgi:hypothetical protein